MDSTRRLLSFTFLAVVILLSTGGTVYALSGEEVWSEYLAGGDSDEMLQQFKRCLDENSGDAYAAAGAGCIEFSRFQSKEAFGQWTRAAELFGEDPAAELFLHLAFDAAEEGGLWKEFEEHWARKGEESTDPASLDCTALFCRTIALRRLGKVDEGQALRSRFGFLQDFLVCGPFDNAEKRGHDRTYGPEESFDPSATYSGRNREVGWEPLPVRSKWGYVNLKAYARPAAESTTYLAAVIEAKSQARARLLVGHAGALKVWINGTPAIDSKRYHGAFPDQVGSQIELQAGANLLLLKVSSSETGKYGVWVRLAPLAGAEPGWRVLSAGEGADRVPESSRAVIAAEVPAFDEEPPAVAAMRQMGPRLEATSPRHLFYALLIDQLDIADEADQSEMLTLSRCLEAFPESAVIRFYAARADREPNRQRQFLTGCIERDPQFLRARLALMDSYRPTPFFNRWRSLIDEALGVAPREPRFVVQKALLLAGEGLMDAAAGRARYATKLDPGFRDPLWHLAEMSGNRMPRKERREIYERLIRRNASDVDAIQRLVRMSLEDGDVRTARKWIVRTSEMDPWHFDLLRNLAEFHLAQGEFEEAIAAAQEGLQISPYDPGLHRIAAMAYRQSGNDDNASEHVAAALAAAPSDPWALDYRKHISPETGDYYTPYRRDKETLPEPAPELVEKANYVTLLHQDVKRVHPNGNSSETVHEVVKVLTDSGLQALGSRGIYYEPATQEVRILRSRVWKKDGTFVDSPAPQHRSTANAGDAAAKLYGDYNVAIVSFPGLEKEAVIELEYQIEEKGENIYADYFGDIFVVGDYEPTVLTEYILITPVARDFYHSYLPPHYPPSVSTENTVFAEEPEETFEGRQRIQRWTFKNLPLVQREPNMPSYSETLPYLKISTFRTWNDMTTWWWNLSKDQFIPGPTVKQKVAEIVAKYRNEKGLGLEDPISDFEKVRIVNSFVNTTVRYLGLEFGIHGYKPHRVDEVCHAQYGDCKDKATLAVSMLKELGVEAYPIILRTTDRGEIDYELPSLGLFNHAIFYVPDADGHERWIDGTAQFFDATELPPSDEGSNSLIVKPGGESQFKRIPTSPANVNGAHYETRITLSADGGGAGRRDANYSGLYNPIVRGTYENRAKTKDLIEQQLVSLYPGGKCVSVELSQLEDYSTPESLSYEFEIPNFATPQGEELSVPVVFFPQYMSRRYAALSKREYDLVLPYRWLRTCELVVTLPEGWVAGELPPTVEEESPFGKYRWSASVEGKEVRIQGEIEFTPLRVTPEEYQAFRTFCQLIDNTEERRIVLRRER
ncbi:MAG: DUF3857 domain-containing protein [bacterium]